MFLVNSALLYEDVALSRNYRCLIHYSGMQHLKNKQLVFASNEKAKQDMNACSSTEQHVLIFKYFNSNTRHKLGLTKVMRLQAVSSRHDLSCPVCLYNTETVIRTLLRLCFPLNFFLCYSAAVFFSYSLSRWLLYVVC